MIKETIDFYSLNLRKPLTSLRGNVNMDGRLVISLIYFPLFCKKGYPFAVVTSVCLCVMTKNVTNFLLLLNIV
jgi:hypothetical protein